MILVISVIGLICLIMLLLTMVLLERKSLDCNRGFTYFCSLRWYAMVFMHYILTLFGANFSRYDLHSGTNDAIGNHQDIAACVGYSIETCKLPVPCSHEFNFEFDTYCFLFFVIFCKTTRYACSTPNIIFFSLEIFIFLRSTIKSRQLFAEYDQSYI